MRCYFINLDRDHARREWVERELKRTGIEFERIPAVLGTALDEEVLADHRQGGGEGLSAGEIGCILSHAAALKAFLATDAPSALIIEDDVHISPQAAGLLGELNLWLETYDIVKVESSPMKTRVTRKFDRVGDRKLHQLLAFNLGAAAYVISRKGAIRILEELQISRLPYDYVMSSPDINRLAIAQMNPSPFVQDIFLPTSTLLSSIGERESRSPKTKTLWKSILRWIKPVHTVLYNLLHIGSNVRRMRAGYR